MLQFSVKLTFSEKYVICISSVDEHFELIIRINKMYHTNDIPYPS